MMNKSELIQALKHPRILGGDASFTLPRTETSGLVGYDGPECEMRFLHHPARVKFSGASRVAIGLLTLDVIGEVPGDAMIGYSEDMYAPGDYRRSRGHHGATLGAFVGKYGPAAS